MPQTRVVFYREDDGSVPVQEWLDSLQKKVKAKCIGKIERPQALGHELRRPEADYLRDNIYELRPRFRNQRYRLLYFFHGNIAAVISHGISKQTDKVPPIEIERAIERKRKFEQNPQLHTQEID